MIKHYLVPVIELPLSLKEWERLGGIFKFEKLSGTHEHCRQAWLSYWETNDVLLDDRSLPEWLVGNCVFPTSEVSECFIGPVVESHCQEYNIDEVSSLFGGYALFANQEPILVPQCCGTLGDIHSWEKLLRDEEYDECFCLEGHPSPEAKTQGSTIVFNCDNEYEEFIGPVAKDYTIPKKGLESVIKSALLELSEFASRIDRYGKEIGTENLSEVLVYRSEYA